MSQRERFLVLLTLVIGAQLIPAATATSPPVLEVPSSTPFEPPDDTSPATNTESPTNESPVEARRLNKNAVGRSSACPTVGGALVDQALAQEDLLSDDSGLAETVVSSFAKPTFYTLRLKADPSKRKFTGQLMIKLNVSSGSSAADREKPASGAPEQAPTADSEGYRYITLHAGPNLQINKAFYVYNSRGGFQVPASRLGRRADLITLDFYPNLITPGQGLLLIVYSGQVNDTRSQGLFVHYSRTPKPRSALLEPLETAADLGGLATHMQPTFARRLLPCWDEPHYKASFSLIAVLPFRGYEVISNTPIKKKSISVNCAGEPTQEIEFHTTPLMSSYLLTLVVGHYEHLEAFSNSNCRVRVFVYANLTQTTGEKSSTRASSGLHHSKMNSRRTQAKLALSVAVSALNHLEELFGVKYPLAKLDLIGVRNFQGGGMENWGAIMFHENYLLYDNTSAASSSSSSSSSSSTDLQLNGGRTRPKLEAIPLVVAHELAHQWFGNLVTASEWRYLWLNEGFAQFLMYELAQHMYPERSYSDQFIEDIRASALDEDELLASSHSLQPLDGPASADESLNIFDQITYNKGAVIVQMLQTFLGRELFYAGLRYYLSANAFSSVKPQKLWHAFEEVGRLPEGRLDNLMGLWCAREGHPLLTVEAFDDGLNWSLKIRQERFTLIRLAGDVSLPEQASIEAAPKSTRINTTNASSTTGTQKPWVIPVSVASERFPRPEARQIRLDAREKHSTTFTFLLEETSSIVNLPRASIGSWLKLNFNATGFYRVNYKPAAADTVPDGAASGPSVDLLRAMMPAIRSKRLSRLDRFNLVDDLFALARSGHKATTYYLQYLSNAFSEETDCMVLRSIVNSLKSIEALVSNAPEHLAGPFQSWAQRYLRSVRRALRQARDNNSNSNLAKSHRQLRETEDLIEASEAHFNEPQSLARAGELFRRTFRTGGRVSPEGPFERELRASIYSAALVESELRANSRQVDSSAASNSHPVYQRLLAGYDSKFSSTERHAITWALGSVRDSSKQSQLLNLTMFDLYFRPSDAHTLLESMARSVTGRELIWAQLSSQHGHLQDKLLLAPALRALVSGGLVERSNTISQRPIESQLRSLYELYTADHGKLLSQSIELLLINSQWLARDQDSLLAYLTDSVGPSATPV